MDHSQAIQRQFGAAAERYAASDYHASGADLAAMLAAAELRGDERVLDLGCGAGHTALAFAPRVAEVVGLDLTEAMLEQARALARERGVSNLRLELGDAMDLAFADATFDRITCRVCAHHFARPAAALREAARVLRPGGTLLLVDSVAPEDAAADTFLNTIELLRDPSHVRNHRVSEWRVMLEEAGFEAECLETWRLPLDFADWTRRMATPPAAVAQLRELFSKATQPLREAFALRADEPAGFEMPIAFLRARLRDG